MSLDILIAGKYRLGRKLGGGSFGEIYLGERLQRKTWAPHALCWRFRHWGNCWCPPGTNIQTGEEVGIKLVSVDVP